MRKFLAGISLITVLIVLLYSYLVWKNNASVTALERTEIEATLENSIQWLEKNRDSVLDIGNPMLWYMVQQAADISGDQRLQRLFANYEQHHLQNRSANLWRPLFYPGSWIGVRFEDISGFPYYNWHFIYASLCDRDLEKVPEIAIQNNPDFCDRHPLRPACVTHQLMGIRLLQRSECGNPAQLDNTVGQLQQRIHRQLLLDPRVVDVYMQRVLMLVESGGGDLIKSIWIRNLVDAQQSDGGWSSFDPLVPLGGDRYFGFGPRIFAVKTPHSDFHMTAQGVLLFSLLTSR